MNKLDKDRNVTQEYLDYVSSLKREDLETFYIGADLLVERLNNNWNELEQWIEKERDKWEKYNPDSFVYYQSILDKIQELKGVDKE